MANLGMEFNPGEHMDGGNDFAPIPNGRYTALVTASEVKPTKAGTGRYLELTFQIVEGEHKGRQIWHRLNIDNPSVRAVEIAKRELSWICAHLKWTEQLTDSTVLHDKPLPIDVLCKPRGDGGGMTNEVKIPKPGEPTAPAQSTDGRPWERI